MHTMQNFVPTSTAHFETPMHMKEFMHTFRGSRRCQQNHANVHRLQEAEDPQPPMWGFAHTTHDRLAKPPKVIFVILFRCLANRGSRRDKNEYRHPNVPASFADSSWI